MFVAAGYAHSTGRARKRIGVRRDAARRKANDERRAMNGDAARRRGWCGCGFDIDVNVNVGIGIETAATSTSTSTSR
ncbi:hypothetical protein C6946_30165 [Burkholderia thailandensis]|nr:hypothetical protein C6946_30165 [Burkholderia thailandensis]